MKEFKVLPSNKDFQNLTNAQVSFIINQMEEDYEQMRSLNAGSSPKVESEAPDWWEADLDDFDPAEGLDEDDINAQLEKLYHSDNPYDNAKVDATTEKINHNLRQAQEEAKALEQGKLMEYKDQLEHRKLQEEMRLYEGEKAPSEESTKALQEAIQKFNEQHGDTQESSHPDDTFYI